MKLTDYNLQENRQNHAKHRNFFENKYLILCALCDLGGFEKFRLKPTKNYTKLCKTNPNSKMPKLTHTLFYKGLMKIFAPFGYQKTNPKRTQTKPNSERAKMNASSVLTRYYENKLVFRPQKNEAKTNPICREAKNEHKLIYHKGLRKCTHWSRQKNKPNQSQFPKGQNELKIACQKILPFQQTKKKSWTIPDEVVNIKFLDKFLIQVQLIRGI